MIQLTDPRVRLKRQLCPQAVVVVAISLMASMITSPVQAAPITAEFSGTITRYSDSPLSPPDDTRTGAAIHGYVIYNVANAERTRIEPSPSGGGYNGVSSDLGCPEVVFGRCSTDWGSDKPVVAEYRIVTPWGSVSSLEGDYGTTTEFGFLRGPDSADIRDLYERIDATRDDRRYTIYDDGSSSFLARQFGFTVFNFFSHGVLFDDLWDLTQLPSAEADPNRPSSVESRLQLWHVAQTCADTFGNGCVSSPDNLWLQADLLDVAFRRGVHRVPEPAGWMLSTLGLMLVAFARIRKTPAGISVRN